MIKIIKSTFRDEIQILIAPGPNEIKLANDIDANIILDFALSRLNNVISNLVVYPKNMKKNLDRLKKLPMSEGLMLAMTQKGLSREKAYKIVQRNAMKVWKTNEDFEVILNRDSEIKKYLNVKEIKKILDIKHAIRNTNHIFKKVFK